MHLGTTWARTHLLLLRSLPTSTKSVVFYNQPIVDFMLVRVITNESSRPPTYSAFKYAVERKIHSERTAVEYGCDIDALQTRPYGFSIVERPRLFVHALLRPADAGSDVSLSRFQKPFTHSTASSLHRLPEHVVTRASWIVGGVYSSCAQGVSVC